jgi:hypothetical protein
MVSTKTGQDQFRAPGRRFQGNGDGAHRAASFRRGPGLHYLAAVEGTSARSPIPSFRMVTTHDEDRAEVLANHVVLDRAGKRSKIDLRCIYESVFLAHAGRNAHPRPRRETRAISAFRFSPIARQRASSPTKPGVGVRPYCLRGRPVAHRIRIYGVYKSPDLQLPADICALRTPFISKRPLRRGRR